MRKHLAAVIVCLFCCTISFSQITVRGVVLNRQTTEPVPYANIGITNRNIGTVSDKNGSFILSIPENLITDSLRFSSVGFAEKKISLRSFSAGKAIPVFITEKPTLLQSVTVTTAKPGTAELKMGSIAVRGGVLQADTAYAGRTLALLIGDKDVKLKPVQAFPAVLKDARLRILRNNLAAFKFRVRVLAFDTATGRPGKDLLNENIVTESTMKKGWLLFDLSAFNFEVSGPFFIAFEQISELKDRIAIANGYRDYITRHPGHLKTDTILFEGKKAVRQTLAGGINLPGTFIATSNSASRTANYSCYEREASFGEWNRTSAVIAATVTLARAGASAGSTNISCAETDLVCRARTIAENFTAESGLAGMQAAISKKGKTILQINLGYADVKNNVPVTDSTLFRLNSISKSVTSLALMQLVAAGRLDLDAPVQRYVPGFPTKTFPITTRQLAGHLAGFRDYDASDPADYIRTEHFESATEALKIFQNDTLLFKPGSQFSYSTFGWNLVAAVIEGASGENYERYMQDNVFTPLQLKHTMPDNVRRPNANRSKFYDESGAENDLGDLSYKYAGGGLLSTTEDLLKMGNEILHGNVIDPKLKGMLFESGVLANGSATGYGLGWYIGKDKSGRRIWHHGGDSFSGSSFLVIYPDDDIVAAFLANGQEGVGFDIKTIAALFY